MAGQGEGAAAAAAEEINGALAVDDGAGDQGGDSGNGAGGSAEERARRMGWVPKEEFRGDPTRWRPAEAFVARAENELPVAQATLRRLERDALAKDRKIESLITNVAELTETLTEFRVFATKGEERAYKRAKAELETQFAAKVADGDVAGATAVRDEIAALGEPPAAPATKTAEQRREEAAAAATQTMDPITVQWIADNAWFNRDQTLNAFATNLHGVLLQTQPTMTLEENLSEVARRTRMAFPEKFPAARRANAAATVEQPTGTRRQGGSGAPGYDDLPADAKKACDRFVKTIPGYKREDYVAQYDWS